MLTCSGALKYQTNVESHPPGCLRANQSSGKQEGPESAEDDERRCREEAYFQPHNPQVCVCVCRYSRAFVRVNGLLQCVRSTGEVSEGVVPVIKGTVC